MSMSRVQATGKATLSHTFYIDETPTDPTGTVTCTVKRLDGTSVQTGSASIVGSGSGKVTFVFNGADTVDILSVDWVATISGDEVTVRDWVEIVGGFYFGIAEARGKHSGLSNTTEYTSADLQETRIEVEQEADVITGQAFVPRFARVKVDGSGTSQLVMPWPLVRKVRSVTVDGVAWAQGQVDAVRFGDAGVLTLDGLWPTGWDNVIVEFEHGHDYPPSGIKRAGILRMRSRLGWTRSGIPDRAVSFTVTPGGVYRLSTPGRNKTGVPDVDGEYERVPRLSGWWIA